MKISENFKNNKQAGQSLLEFLIAFFLILLCAASVMEISRLLSFKNSLQAASSYVSHKIAYSQIDLIQKKIISKSEQTSQKLWNGKVSNELKSYFKDISSENIRVQINFVNEDKNLPSGVYLEAQTCLPLLFSKYFTKIKSPPNVTVGKEALSKKHNCLGEFTSNESIFWFKIRVAAYSPWPAATQIYEHGLSEPLQYKILERDNIRDTQQAVEELNLTQFFIEKR